MSIKGRKSASLNINYEGISPERGSKDGSQEFTGGQQWNLMILRGSNQLRSSENFAVQPVVIINRLFTL